MTTLLGLVGRLLRMFSQDVSRVARKPRLLIVRLLLGVALAALLVGLLHLLAGLRVGLGLGLGGLTALLGCGHCDVVAVGC